MLNPVPDPLFARRASLGASLVVLLLLCVSATGFNPALLTDPATLASLAGFTAQFWPPALGSTLLAEVAAATVTTLACATLGLALAMLVGAPAAYFGCRTLGEAAVSHTRAQPLAAAAGALLRGVLVAMRAVPEVVWALLFVRAIGLGTLPAVLALGVAYGGMLGKVYAEILESQPREFARALGAAGAGRLARLAYGVLPGALPELVSYTVYRFECAVRASALMGLVGAGGLGLLLDNSLKMMNGAETATLLIAFLLLVGAADASSRLARLALATARGTAALALAFTSAVLASLWQLDTLWQGGVANAGALARFAAEFWPPDVSASLWATLAGALWQTLAMSVLGTLLAVLVAAALALPAAGELGVLPQLGARALLALVRGIPDLVWAMLAVLALGLGPAAGVLALALHTSGVLGRLFAETLQNTPAECRQALAVAGAGRATAFAYGVLPQVLPQWLAYTLYRWENNIRSASVLGIVGAGGVGGALFFALSLFQMPTAATLIVAMVMLSWLAETASARLRAQLG